MSDDEEVVFEGSDLYKYLIDQGYSDFTSLSPNCYKNDVAAKYPQNNYISFQTTISQPLDTSISCTSPITVISVSDYNKLLNVLQSQLLFKEDIDILEPILSTTSVYNRNFNFYSLVSVCISGLFLSTVPFLKPKIRYYLPIGIAVLCTTVSSSWLFYLKFLESRENRQFVSHLSLLQNVCSNIHRVFRCVKETEIISTGKVSNNNIGIAAYTPLPIGLGFKKSNELGSLPHWKTLPQVRRCLMDVLVVTIELFNEAIESLKTVAKPLINNCIFESLEYRNTLKALEEMLSDDQCISLQCLHSVNDVYLAVQSEYLKWIALSIFNIADSNSITLNLSNRKTFFKMLSYSQSKLVKVSSKLISLYHTHNISAIAKSHHKLTKQNDDKKRAGLHNLQVEIHNISLLILSILLRVRSLEDSLGEISEIETETKLNMDINEHLASLKDDLTCIVKCYDTIYHRLVSENKTISKSEENELKTSDVLEPISTKTGIVVGVSDFNVNSPDEVFLAISGNNNQGQENTLDDWLFERKPQIPKNLIEELCKTLKSRKEHFSEREKQALQRQGLQDIQDSFENSSSDESLKIEYKKKRLTPKTNKGLLQIHDERSSSSEDDDTLNIIKNKKTGEHTSYEKLQTASSSDSVGSFTDNVPDISSNCSINNKSLANIIAIKSQLWKKTEEENYSDG